MEPKRKKPRNEVMKEPGKDNIEINLIPSHIKCFYDKTKDDEKELIQRAMNGETITSLIYPLLFDISDIQLNSNSNVFYRSLPFLRSLGKGDGIRYENLEPSQQYYVHIGLRDLYFASLMNMLSDDDKTTLLNVTDMVLENENYFVEGLSVSFYPSRNRKLLKYMHIPLATLQETNSDELFIQPTAPIDSTETSIRAVFVDPHDLSYHNFESIVRLDSWFQTFEPIQLATSRPHQLTPELEIFTFNILGLPSPDPLHQLDGLDLYTPPLNSSTRGGNRFIFQSHQLSSQLSQMIRSSGVLELMSPSNYSSGNNPKYSAANSFVSVNSVFRLNKFVPGDRNFESHLDTPYSDRAHHHFSRYSILIYLSAGRNQGTLSFEGGKVTLDELNDMNCVLFRQDYEHSGRAYVDTTKIFLRSELIFYIEDDDRVEDEPIIVDTDLSSRIKKSGKKDASNKMKQQISQSSRDDWNNGVKGIQYDKLVGKLFTSAVYFTGQSIFEPELSSYAHKCYELSNKLHWKTQLSRLSHESVEKKPVTKGKSKGKSKKAEQPEQPEKATHFELQLIHKSLDVTETFGETSVDFVQNFVTCGSDYWFQRAITPDSNQLLRDAHNILEESYGNENELYIKECAMYAILDYFNCHYDEGKKKKKSFRSLCQTTILNPPMLETFDQYESFAFSSLDEFAKTFTKKRGSNLRISWNTGNELSQIPFVNHKPLPKPNSEYCCPFHSYPVEDDFDEDTVDRIAAMVPSLNRYYVTCREYAENKLKNTPIFFNWLGNNIILNDDSFVVDGDKVYVLNHTNTDISTNRVNFAACWNGGGMDSYIGVSESISSKHLLIPPILFRSVVDKDGYQRVHLMLDFFENNWSTSTRDREIPIPEMAYSDDEDETNSYRRMVHSQFFHVDWDEDTWEEKFQCEINRVDLEGDKFISPCYDSDHNEASDDDEDNGDDSDEDSD